MENSAGKIYAFGRFQLDASERLLFDGERMLSLAPKVFDTLLLLVENGGHLIRKEDMLEKIWADSFVEENNLAQNISYLRKVLGENKTTKFIETVPKLGYRFVAPVSLCETGEPEIVYEQTRARLFFEEDDGTKRQSDQEKEVIFVSPSPSHSAAPSQATQPEQFIPETRYVQNGDANIAYQTVGTGDLDIVFVMGWVSHLEYFWREPHFAAFLNRLASFSRLILFDKRGTGLSDRFRFRSFRHLSKEWKTFTP